MISKLILTYDDKQVKEEMNLSPDEYEAILIKTINKLNLKLSKNGKKNQSNKRTN